MDRKEILSRVDHTLLTPTATWEQVKRPDSRELVLMDDNVLACGHGLEQIAHMGQEEVWGGLQPGAGRPAGHA